MATENAIGSEKPIQVAFGGTGADTLTEHGVLIGSGVAAIIASAAGTNGQVLLGSTGADPVFATLASAGGTITFTSGAGTLNLESEAEDILQINEQVGAAYTLVLTDAGKLITLSDSSAVALTVPTNAAVAFPIGTSILLTQVDDGQVEVDGDVGVTVLSRGNVFNSKNISCMVSLIKVDTDVWILSGDLA